MREGTSGSEGESLPLAENGANGVSGNENQGGVVQNDGEMIEKSEAVIQANGALAQNNGAMAQNNSVDTQSTNADAQKEIDLANHSYQSNSPVNDILQPTEAFILTPDNKNTQETSVIQEMAPDRTDLPVVTIELKPVDLLEEPTEPVAQIPNVPADAPILPLNSFQPFEDPNSLSSKFYVGAAVGVKNQWLMNHDTYETFRSEGLNHAVADFSSAQNVNFGWRFADRFGVQADYAFLAAAGQKYNEYSQAGRFVSKEMDFQYQKMLVTFRYNRKSKKLLGREISDHMAVGMYGGYLTEAQRIGGIQGTAKFLPEYRNVDFGFTGTYEVNYAIIPRLKFSTGLRLQQGLLNIYKGDELIPADFDRTFNASVDLLFGLKYELQKKSLTVPTLFLP